MRSLQISQVLSVLILLLSVVSVSPVAANPSGFRSSLDMTPIFVMKSFALDPNTNYEFETSNLVPFFSGGTADSVISVCGIGGWLNGVCVANNDDF